MTSTYTKEDYARAYTEVLGMIKYFSSESLDKIPEDVIQMYEENKDENYDFEFDRNRSFEDQEISKLAKILIANIFTDYIATDEEREYLNYKDQKELEKIEEEKRNKYNPNEIFNNRNRKEKIQEDEIQIVNLQEKQIAEDENTSITTVKENESILKRILEKVRSIFIK